MPTPVKNGLFPAAGPPVKPAGIPAPDARENFQEELVRRRDAASAERSDARAADPPSSREAEARRAERRKPDAVGRRRRKEAAREAGPVTFEEGAGDQASAPDDAAAPESLPAERAGSTPVDGQAIAAAVDPEPSEGADGSAAMAAFAGPHQAATADGTTVATPRGATGDAEAESEPTAVAPRPAVYHASAPDPTEQQPGADDAASPVPGGPAEAVAPALFNDTSAEAGEGTADDAAERQRPAGDAASAALTDDDAAFSMVVEIPATEGPSAPGRTVEPLPSVTAAPAGFDPRPDARTASAPSAPALPPAPPEVRFAAANHENIVKSMRSELLPKGGSMRIRLDPPLLGALQVTVEIRDGLITAAFETSSDEATRLLGHSLNHLKSVLESQGVAVDKLQVQQAPREAQAQHAGEENRREQGGQSQEQEQSARQEQQRREMLRRMWRRLTGGQDPLDLRA